MCPKRQDSGRARHLLDHHGLLLLHLALQTRPLRQKALLLLLLLLISKVAMGRHAEMTG